MSTFSEPVAPSHGHGLLRSLPNQPAAVHEPRIRASDAEREETVVRLHDALGEGRLDLGETEERVAAAYEARHRDELPPLVADLPDDDRAASAAPAWHALWQTTAWRLRILVLGPAAAGEPPTPQQCRTVAWLVAAAVAWMILCALIGAAAVA